MTKGLDIAYAMMKNPDKKPSVDDFFENRVNFDTDPWDNDDIVNLHLYHKEWFWYNLTQSIMHGEHRPSSGYLNQIMDELGIPGNIEYLDKLVFAGECVAEEREWREMSEEELAEVKAMRKHITSEFNDPDSVLNEGVKYAIDKVTSQNEELKNLDKLFKED